MWKWGFDKFNTGYRIFTLAYFKRFDCYIFHYPEGSHIPKHKDPGSRGAHWRLNFEFIKPEEGGEFYSQQKYSFWRFHLFRADKYYHGVTKIDKGSRWLLSFGITI